MKNATIALALAAAFSTSAFAATDVPTPNTRAEVVAELQQARAHGDVQRGELTRFKAPSGPSLSRAEVLTDLRDARAAHQLPQTTLDYPPKAVGETTVPSRAQVVQELQAARANGELDGIGY